jgi:hypothetical protein
MCAYEELTHLVINDQDVCKTQSGKFLKKQSFGKIWATSTLDFFINKALKRISEIKKVKNFKNLIGDPSLDQNKISQSQKDCLVTWILVIKINHFHETAHHTSTILPSHGNHINSHKLIFDLFPKVNFDVCTLPRFPKKILSINSQRNIVTDGGFSFVLFN